MALLFVIGWLFGCDDTIFPAQVAEPVGGEGYCAVTALFDANCVACHSAGAVTGGLDLETDPRAALVDQPSANYPDRTLVVPGDPDASFLVVKVEGTQDADEGGSMPPGSSLDADSLAILRDWIADGATIDCGDTGG